MDNALARHVALTAYRSKQGLEDMLEMLQRHCDPAEYETIRNGVALVERGFQTLLDRVFADHPGLKSDIGQQTQKFGRPL